MALSAEEARVLACLIEEGSATGADADPMTLDAVRLACNQTTGRRPIVTYDDRTADTALLSLKSMGLVRFVQTSDGGRVTRYRQTADDRWRLGRTELGVLAALVLRGPQNADEIRAGAPNGFDGAGAAVDDALDTLASRRPEPFVRRIDSGPDHGDVRFVHMLLADSERTTPSVRVGTEPDPTAEEVPGASVASLAAEVAFLRARVDRLEHELGLAADDRTERRRDS